jgi:hypothetical protein
MLRGKVAKDEDADLAQAWRDEFCPVWRQQPQGEQKKALMWRKDSGLQAHARHSSQQDARCHLRLNNLTARGAIP